MLSNKSTDKAYISPNKNDNKHWPYFQIALMFFKIGMLQADVSYCTIYMSVQKDYP